MRVLGKRPLNEVLLWMKASDILLMPHPSNTYYRYYVSPLKMFEYMASRRPIVGTKLPAIEEILSEGESALLGELGGAESIAENIRRLLGNPELGRNLADKALEIVQRCTWNGRAEQVSNFMARYGAY